MGREIFDKKLAELNQNLRSLETMVSKMLLDSVGFLLKRDLESSHRIYNNDLFVNQMHVKIEENCIILIATQQPIAADLRYLASMIDVNNQLERIGDYAKGIARINNLIGNEQLLPPFQYLPKMADLTVSMLHRSVIAFLENDMETSKAIPPDDDLVDDMFNQVFQEIFPLVQQDPLAFKCANYLIWVAHNLERTADRVTNICERTIYNLTGQLHVFDLDDELSEQHWKKIVALAPQTEETFK
jgi:phosphate transport system protein